MKAVEKDSMMFFAYEIASSDYEASKLLDICRSSFSIWRRKNEIPAWNNTSQKVPDEDESMRFFAYEVAKTDDTASKLVGMSPGGFSSWRIRSGLPPQQKLRRWFIEDHGYKRCSQCGEVKDSSKFNPHSNGPAGIHSSCDDCERLIRRKSRLSSKYGLTLKEFESLLDGQGYKCAVCDTPESELSKGLFVDHDHDNGDVRGLLCFPCNAALGQLKDDDAVIRTALEYVQNGGV